MRDYSGSPLYGRKYKVIAGAGTGLGLEVSDLHCTFSVEKTMAIKPNSTVVKIYNLSAGSRNAIMTGGGRILIEAGYEEGAYGLIFDGDMVKARGYLEDTTTNVTEITAQDGDVFLSSGFVNVSYGAGETAGSIFAALAGQGPSGVTMGEVSTTLSTSKLARGKVLFGQPRDYARTMAKGEGALFFVNDRKLCLVKPEDPPAGEVFRLSPASGLIGSPEYTDGRSVKAKCLLNPVLNLNQLVNVENWGVYRILTLTHTGDTRGQEWYTEFTGIAQAGTIPQTGKSYST